MTTSKRVAAIDMSATKAVWADEDKARERRRKSDAEVERQRIMELIAAAETRMRRAATRVYRSVTILRNSQHDVAVLQKRLAKIPRD